MPWNIQSCLALNITSYCSCFLLMVGYVVGIECFSLCLFLPVPYFQKQVVSEILKIRSDFFSSSFEESCPPGLGPQRSQRKSGSNFSVCFHQLVPRLCPASLKPRRNWESVLLSLMSCWHQPCLWCSLQLRYYCTHPEVLILQETFCQVDDFVIPRLFMVQWGRLRCPVELHRKELTRACSFVPCNVAHIFGGEYGTREVLYMSCAFSAFHPKASFQRERSIQRKWIVQFMHPLWNTRTTHPPNSRGNLWEGRTGQRSEHLHTSIYFIFVSRRCTGRFHCQHIQITLNVSKIYSTGGVWVIPGSIGRGGW